MSVNFKGKRKAESLTNEVKNENGNSIISKRRNLFSAMALLFLYLRMNTSNNSNEIEKKNIL
jgi:hypothetical protein